MIFALTTHWNAAKHKHGEALVDEILALGFRHLELGYNTRLDLVPGIRKRLREGAIAIDSVHNYCPVPIASPRGHPELYTLAHRDPDTRRKAIHHTAETVRFASEVGARVVVAHAGNVAMRNLTRRLTALYEDGHRDSARYQRLKLRLQVRRDRKAPAQFEHLLHGLEELLPLLEELQVALALELLPSWEALPSEVEFQDLFERMNSPYIRLWYDIGHARIRENLGFTHTGRWLERLGAYLAGFHVHDVEPPARDHVMPPRGAVDFSLYRPYALRNDMLRVLEPAPGTPEDHIREGLRILQEAWNDTPSAPCFAPPERQENVE